MTPSEAVVLAGGLGTRLQGVLQGLPKPMAPVHGRPFLSYVLDHLANNDISKVLLSVHHMHERISEQFGEHYNGMAIEYVVEEELLGTGGAIRLASESIAGDTFFALNGDTFFDVELARMVRFHTQQQTPLTLAAKPMADCSRYGSLNLTQDHRVASFNEKKNGDAGMINGGIYLINKRIWDHAGPEKKFSFERDLMPELCSKGYCSAYRCDGFFIDIGIPEDLEKARSHDSPFFSTLTNREGE